MFSPEGRARFFRGAEKVLRAAGFLERRCVICREPFEREALFVPKEELSVEGVLRNFVCPDCRRDLPRREAGFCPYCGEPSVLEEAPCMPCGRCMEKMPPWRDFLFFGIYGGRLRELILRVKFGGSLATADMLGRLMAALCLEHYAPSGLPDVLVPVPLDAKRLHERGFNQCRELIRSAERILGMPVCTEMLVKRHASVPQEALNREQRQDLKQPFEATCRADGLHVLLVDDVCTTGATLDRAARCLLNAGASRVDVVVLARASLHEPLRAGASSLP